MFTVQSKSSAAARMTGSRQVTANRSSSCRSFPRSLKSLSVGCFGHTPDEMLQRISEEPSLRELFFAASSDLTDASVRKLFKDCCRTSNF